MAITAKRRFGRRMRQRDRIGQPRTSAATADIIRDIRRGYPWPLAHRLQDRLDFTDTEFAAFLGLSGRTLSRRRKGGSVLDKVASDRLYRIMRVVHLAGEVFEDQALGLQWLRRAQAGLGGKVPLELLDTEPGFEAVETFLHQIEYGVLS